MKVNTPSFETPATLRGRGTGIIVCAGFAAVWACAARTAWAPLGASLTMVVVVVLSGALLVAGILMIRRGRGFSLARSASRPPRRHIWRDFCVVLLAEIVALNILAYMLGGHHLIQYLMPGMAIIVGLHFFPLARIFRAGHMYATAVVMTLAGMGAVLAIATGNPAVASSSIADAICALTLWITGLVSWYSARPALASHSIASQAGSTP